MFNKQIKGSQEWTGYPSHLLPRLPSVALSPAGIPQVDIGPSTLCSQSGKDLQRPAKTIPNVFLRP